MFFFFNDTATTEIYTLSLHDALPIYAAFPRIPCPLGAAGGSSSRSHDPVYGRAALRRALDVADRDHARGGAELLRRRDRKSTRLNSSHANISYAVFCLKKKNTTCTPR